MVTKRVRGREFRLRPSERTNALVMYVVAVVARRTNVRIHAISVLSNHWHVCLSDPDGRICEFTRDCHSFIARSVNAAHGDFESLWSSEQTSHVHCVEPDDLIGKIAYVMANPVEGFLVRFGHTWPGVRAAWPQAPRVVKRPRGFFRGENEGGVWPDEATFELSRPSGHDELSDHELAERIEAAITEREERFRQQADREGIAFLGRRQVLRQSRHACPKTRAPRFGVSPRVACKNKWRRIERLRQNRAWTRDYAVAWRAWANGDRDVVFPHATYQMRVFHRVTCAPPPS